YVRLLTHVAGDWRDVVTDAGVEGGNGRLEARQVARRRDHVDTPCGECGHGRMTYAEACAGDDSHLSSPIVHPFTAPSLRPRTRSFCAKVKTMIAGRLITTEAAMSSPQR